MWRYFKTSFLSLFLGLAVIAILTQDLQLLGIGALLILLEVSLSFDNAVINAKILSHMSPEWQRRFLIWGILIAVVGMRLLLPVVMVSFTSDYSIFEIMHFVLYQPQTYGEALHQGLPIILSFGSAFLLMVSAVFFFESLRTVYWIRPFEQACQTLSKCPQFLWLFIVLATGFFCVFYQDFTLRVAFVVGLISQYGLHAFNDYLKSRVEMKGHSHSGGWVGFLYLEVLDASFSFDGVVGAFALTHHLFIIMIGLGIGAIFVRSFTIYLVDHAFITRIRYLDHGAHYAVLSLAVMMMIQISTHLPEWLIGSISALLILLSIGCSFLKR